MILFFLLNAYLYESVFFLLFDVGEEVTLITSVLLYPPLVEDRAASPPPYYKISTTWLGLLYRD